MEFSRQNLACIIDDTPINPKANKGDVVNTYWEAEKYRSGYVVVNPNHVSIPRQCLEASEVKVCSAVGFTFGATLPKVKAEEARKGVELGAEKLDMVMQQRKLQ